MNDNPYLEWLEGRFYVVPSSISTGTYTIRRVSEENSPSWDVMTMTQLTKPLADQIADILNNAGDKPPKVVTVIVSGVSTEVTLHKNWETIGAITTAARWQVRSFTGQVPFDSLEVRNDDGELLEPHAPIGPWLKFTALHVDPQPGIGG